MWARDGSASAGQLTWPLLIFALMKTSRWLLVTGHTGRLMGSSSKLGPPSRVSCVSK